MNNLPMWASSETAAFHFAENLAQILRHLSKEEREACKQSGIKRFGRLAEVVFEIATIKADAPLLLKEAEN